MKEIEEICEKWNKRNFQNTKNYNNDMIKILSGLESLSLQGIKRQYETCQYIYKAQKITRFYSDENILEKARLVLPIDEFHEKAQVLLGEKSFEEALVITVLKWFKNEFFKWVNSPECTNCGKTETVEGVGAIGPSEQELKDGANRVELHKCKICHTSMRFPRYNHPLKLLQTRKGRCGEWANAFTLICSALGLETRYILDLTDHVWTEIFIPKFNRWVHVDSCEEAFDTPLMYESGWGKQLTFVIALSSHGFVDVTPRYTRKLDQVTLKRNIDEISFAKTLYRWTRNCRKDLPVGFQNELNSRDKEEEAELIGYTRQDRVVQEKELIGRQSGSMLWRRARGEHE